jgi:hypothetical protein
MLIAIHQPHFIPWLGYLHRMAQVDTFIVLDHVQFERRNYQNRSQIRLDGQARWLTVPVVQRSQKERIIDKEVDNRDAARAWGPNHFATLRHAYREAGFFSTYAAALRKVLEARWHQFAHPVYKQCGTAPFIPGLAAVDLLFNAGPASRAILMGEAATHGACAAA